MCLHLVHLKTNKELANPAIELTATLESEIGGFLSVIGMLSNIIQFFWEIGVKSIMYQSLKAKYSADQTT